MLSCWYFHCWHWVCQPCFAADLYKSSLTLASSAMHLNRSSEVMRSAKNVPPVQSTEHVGVVIGLSDELQQYYINVVPHMDLFRKELSGLKSRVRFM